MSKKPSRGIPAPFHAAVVFAVFFSMLGSPLSKGNYDLGGLRGIVAKLQALFYDERSSDQKANGGETKKGGRKFWIYSDPTYDPPPPPPPPPPKP